MKVVLDTNVFISGLMLPKSIPGKIIQAWSLAHFDLLLSEEMLQEIGKVLEYPKIKKRMGWNPKKISRFLLLLRFKSEIMDISKVSEKVPRDQKDNSVLGAYIAGHADYLVSGDQDLLELRERYSILSPKEFSNLL